MKKDLLLILGLALLGQACQSGSQKPDATDATPTTENFQIIPGQQVGPLTSANARENDLVRVFGAKNVKKQPIYVGEGVEVPGYVVFGDTPEAMEILYDTAIAKNKPAMIRIAAEGTRWKTTTGITIGTTLAELVKINGKDFDLYGFGWDYGGAVADWKGGKLNTNLRIFLTVKQDEYPDAILGDRVLSSSDPALKGLPVVVFSMDIGL